MEKNVHAHVCVYVSRQGWQANQEQTFIGLFPVLSSGDI